ncbi:MAG: Rrf2 family transcriptional regulator [Phycisphaerae bacterium]|nr:MAG: Rrf2 family transcriptional regulator [Phycisphaerae bacterium]
MLSLSRKSDYALLALAEMARGEDCSLSIRMLADRLDVPPRMMTNILNSLTHRGLVKSCRGAQGGYSLALSPRDITVLALLEAIEGPAQLALCCCEDDAREEDKCRIKNACGIQAPIQKIHEAICELLGQVTVHDIAFNRVTLNVGAAVALVKGNPN